MNHESLHLDTEKKEIKGYKKVKKISLNWWVSLLKELLQKRNNPPYKEYTIGWDPWIKKRVNYLSCRGVLQTFPVLYDSTRPSIFYHDNSIDSFVL